MAWADDAAGGTARGGGADVGTFGFCFLLAACRSTGAIRFAAFVGASAGDETADWEVGVNVAEELAFRLL